MDSLSYSMIVVYAGNLHTSLRAYPFNWHQAPSVCRPKLIVILTYSLAWYQCFWLGLSYSWYFYSCYLLSQIPTIFHLVDVLFLLFLLEPVTTILLHRVVMVLLLMHTHFFRQLPWVNCTKHGEGWTAPFIVYVHKTS